MTDAEKKRYLDYLEMVNELELMVQDGVNLYLNGKKSSAEEIALDCYLNESDNYMKDYYFRSPVKKIK